MSQGATDQLNATHSFRNDHAPEAVSRSFALTACVSVPSLVNARVPKRGRPAAVWTRQTWKVLPPGERAPGAVGIPARAFGRKAFQAVDFLSVAVRGDVRGADETPAPVPGRAGSAPAAESL